MYVDCGQRQIQSERDKYYTCNIVCGCDYRTASQGHKR